MGLLEDALESAKFDDNDEQWLDRVILKIRELNDDNSDLSSGKLIDFLEDNSETIKAMGMKSLILFTFYAASGNKNEAYREFYRSKFSARDIINNILDNAVDLDRLYKEKQEMMGMAAQLFVEFVKLAKTLLPILLSLV